MLGLPRARSLLLLGLVSCATACAGEDPGDGRRADLGGDSGATDLGAPDLGPVADLELPQDEGRPPDGSLGGDGGFAATLARVPVSEEWPLPGLERPVEVLLDAYGQPRLFGEREVDLERVQGFVLGRDRYFQILLMARFGLGELASILGELGLAADLRAREQGLRQVAERLLEHMAPAQSDSLDRFAAGLGEWVAAVRSGALPPPDEFALLAPLLGAPSPADLVVPLTRRDLAGLAAIIVFQLGWDDLDLAQEVVLRGLPETCLGAPNEELRCAGLLADLWGPVAPVHEVPSAPGWGLDGAAPQQKRAAYALAPKSGPARGPVHPGPAGLNAAVRRALRGTQALRRTLGLGERDGLGSNGWAVSGPRSGTGAHTYLCGDGHLPLSLPSLFYPMGLDSRALGGEDFQRLGLFFPGIPFLAVGTSGAVAWTQTRFYGDITDWYEEELRVDEDGIPSAALFRGEWRPLRRTDEVYLVAEVPTLGSAGRSETWPRWETFDGRHLVSVEGHPAEATAAAPAARLSFGGVPWVVADEDGDGRIHAVSFDYTGFDVGDLLGALRAFGRAGDTAALRDATRSLVAYSQNIVAADRGGGLLYTAYNATPCRAELERDEAGLWLPGADPRRLLDGTRHGGFEVPLDPAGRVDEGPGAADPSRCVVPFERWPQAMEPASGFVLNANQDPAGLTFDGSLGDDPWYLGGPWATGHRAARIRDELSRIVAAGALDLSAMQALQADHRSNLAVDVLPALLGAIDEARALAERPAGELAAHEQRLAALFLTDEERLLEVRRRLGDWIAGGAVAASGVETSYEQPDAADRQAAVATTLFNAWWRAYFAAVFDDEGLDELWSLDPRRLRVGAMQRLLQGRGPEGAALLASWDPATQESVYFDRRATPEVERSAEVALQALLQALDALAAPSDPPGEGGYGSPDMELWLWGLRHRVRLESLLATYGGDLPAVSLIARPFALDTSVLPLAPDLAPSDPRRPLRWFPRPGDWLNVDAANVPGAGASYDYATGPVMRMVVEFAPEGVRVANVVPGGVSSAPSSPHFADLAALWLGNRAVTQSLEPRTALAASERRIRFVPAPAAP